MKTRIHTIIWGALLLGIATLFLVGSLVDLSGLNPALIVVIAAVGLGTLLILAAILGTVLRLGRKPESAAETGPEASAAFPPQP
ncbi:hypothetical protein [Diaminobutyricimonas sp. LJ205]|uniref:hypothetical protein n=1 Tax=Diaminobutyricimonas sp. LJ205 TaxID=2683590 RepID=UPI0012F4D399|nr:hypothetical protein [Diaminobutyricimonas sp. LJ205]